MVQLAILIVSFVIVAAAVMVGVVILGWFLAMLIDLFTGVCSIFYNAPGRAFRLVLWPLGRGPALTVDGVAEALANAVLIGSTIALIAIASTIGNAGTNDQPKRQVVQEVPKLATTISPAITLVPAENDPFADPFADPWVPFGREYPWMVYAAPGIILDLNIVQPKD